MREGGGMVFAAMLISYLTQKRLTYKSQSFLRVSTKLNF